MRILDDLFPPGDTFAVLFRRLLPVSAKITGAILLLCGITVLFGAGSVVIGDTVIRGFVGFLVSLLMIPPAVLIFALIGACHLYFGRKVSFLRAAFAPRSTDK